MTLRIYGLVAEPLVGGYAASVVASVHESSLGEGAGMGGLY